MVNRALGTGGLLGQEQGRKGPGALLLQSICPAGPRDLLPEYACMPGPTGMGADVQASMCGVPLNQTIPAKRPRAGPLRRDLRLGPTSMPPQVPGRAPLPSTAP